MDPLTIAASTVGLLGAAAKVSTVLTAFVSGTRYAPTLAKVILQEVSDISVCLAQLQTFLSGSRVGSRSRTAMIMVEQVVVTLTACMITFSELEEVLGSLKLDDPQQLRNRVTWARRESVLTRLLDRLHSSRTSLNLMLTTLTWYECTENARKAMTTYITDGQSGASVDQATSSVENLTRLVQQVLRTNQYLFSRLGNLESVPDNQTARSAASKNEIVMQDDTLSVNPKPDNSELTLGAVEPPIRRFEFEQDLHSSRVYTRAMKRKTRESLVSSAAFSFGWSCLSEMSLADISNISVISLPVSASDLSNSEHYASGKVRPIAKSRLEPLTVGSLSKPLPDYPSITYIPSKHQLENPLKPTKIPATRILLLGTSRSGKTTLFRQLRRMHGRNFVEFEREDARTTILHNLVTASILLYARLNDSGITLTDQQREVCKCLFSYLGTGLSPSPTAIRLPQAPLYNKYGRADS